MNKRLLYLCLCLFCLPFLVGCDEIAKANAKNSTDEKAKSDSLSSPDGGKKAKRPFADLSDFPTTDPLFASAIQAREQLIQQEEELLERLDELRALLATAKADPSRMRQSVEEFLELAKEMRKISMQAGESINSLMEITSDLSRSTKHLASSYKASADLFRKKAKDYTEKKLREQLLAFASDYEQIAKSIPERTKTLESFQRKLPKLKSKVREANAFLDDVVLFLSSHPGVGSDPREKYSGQFESFAVTFSDWLKTLEEFRTSLREKAISKVIQDGYRKDVLAWKLLEETKLAELAKVEQAKQEEQLRQAKLAEAEQQKLIAERERLAKEREQLALERERLAKAETPQGQAKPMVVAPSVPPNPMPSVVVTTACVPLPTYCVSYYSQPVSCTNTRPCRFRLFTLFRRG